MKRLRKSILPTLLAVFMLTTFYLAYRLLDAGTYFTDVLDYNARLQKRSVLSIEILNSLSLCLSGAAIESIAKRAESEGYVVNRNGNVVQIGDFFFTTVDGHISVSVEDLL
jgi:hypothetical protein